MHLVIFVTDIQMPIQTRKRARLADPGPANAPELTRPAKRVRTAKKSTDLQTDGRTISAEVPAAAPTGPKMRILCLLRAVNVSGSNMCNMKRLVELTTERLGWGNVKTYLQSGNLAADVPASLSLDEVAEQLKTLLAGSMKVHSTVVVRTLSELEALVSACPYDTSNPTKVHVFFLASPPTPAALATLAQLQNKDDDFTYDGGSNLFLSYPNGAGRAALTGGVLEKALGVQGTGRNWRSVLSVRVLLLT
jgi:uncharacterized protein (DUF1697 family)